MKKVRFLIAILVSIILFIQYFPPLYEKIIYGKMDETYQYVAGNGYRFSQELKNYKLNSTGSDYVKLFGINGENNLLSIKKNLKIRQDVDNELFLIYRVKYYGNIIVIKYIFKRLFYIYLYYSINYDKAKEII